MRSLSHCIINVMCSLLFLFATNAPSMLNAMEGDPVIQVEQNKPIPSIYSKLIQWGVFPATTIFSIGTAFQAYALYMQYDTPLQDTKPLQIGALVLNTIALIFAYKALLHGEVIKPREE